MSETHSLVAVIAEVLPLGGGDIRVDFDLRDAGFHQASLTIERGSTDFGHLVVSVQPEGVVLNEFHCGYCAPHLPPWQSETLTDWDDVRDVLQRFVDDEERDEEPLTLVWAGLACRHLRRALR